MTKYNDLYSKVEYAIEKKINKISGRVPDILYKGIKYAIFSGGKRLRPLMLIASALTNGVSEEKVLPLAISLELIHSYSLVHDDLPGMDNDMYRRGKPSVYAKYGQGTAILIGDALLNLAYENMLSGIEIDSQLLKPCSYIAQKAGLLGMISGQFYDITPSKSFNNLLDIFDGKTCALFEAAIVTPLFLSNNIKSINDYENLANLIGKIFQLKDDISDYNNKNDINNIVRLKGLDFSNSYLETLKKSYFKIINFLNIEDSILVDIVSNAIINS